MAQAINLTQLVGELIAFSYRQGDQEAATADFIIAILSEHGISVTAHDFSTSVPRVREAFLTVDGKSIPCGGCSFVSGVIEGKDHIISSLVWAPALLDVPNISFNPQCAGISLSNFYFAPAVAISRESVPAVLAGQNVRAEVNVDKYDFRSKNILVGNTANPRNIVFTHYDSIHTGAVDNASGVAVVLNALVARPELLAHTLYVIAGNEELSYDRPTYWGRGYRAFERDFGSLLGKCEKIIVIDSVGNGPAFVDQNPELVYLGFPLSRIDSFQKKIWMIYGDMKQLMMVYHSPLDTLDCMKEEFLQDALRKMVRELA